MTWLRPQNRFQFAPVSRAAFVFVCGLPFAAHAQYTCLTNDNVLTITKYIGAESIVEIPSAIDGLTVAAIGNNAFSFNIVLTEVTIPSTIIGIGKGAFAFCPKLASINVAPDNAAYMDREGVLFNKAVTELIQFPEAKGGVYSIPNSVTSVGKAAFQDCRTLTSIAIPDSVTRIGAGAFGNCIALTTLVIPNSISAIEDATFSNCGGLRNITIPSSVTAIGNYAFTFCGFEEVTLPSGLQTIGNVAFANCPNLAIIKIAGSVTHVGTFAFSSCTSLKVVYFAGDRPSLGIDPFQNASKATVYYSQTTQGWVGFPTFGSLPVTTWDATGKPEKNATTAEFGLNITGTSGLDVVVEATNSLEQPNWTTIGTNTLAGVSAYVNDPLSTNHATRFYRLRSP